MKEKMNKKKYTVLTCKSVKFYSMKDEDAFFEWIYKISCIKKIDGAKDELYLHITSKNISKECLRDVIGIFYRYKINMQQLQVFLNKKNKKWFHDNPEFFWHTHVFGKTPSGNLESQNNDEKEGK